jgi:hypothetical protein
VEIIPNALGQTYPAGGIELITFQDVDCFVTDPPRFVFANDALLNQTNAPLAP